MSGFEEHVTGRGREQLTIMTQRGRLALLKMGPVRTLLIRVCLARSVTLVIER